LGKIEPGNQYVQNTAGKRTLLKHALAVPTGSGRPVAHLTAPRKPDKRTPEESAPEPAAEIEEDHRLAVARAAREEAEPSAAARTAAYFRGLAAAGPAQPTPAPTAAARFQYLRDAFGAYPPEHKSQPRVPKAPSTKKAEAEEKRKARLAASVEKELAKHKKAVDKFFKH
jgi:hypothetical protein